MKSLMNKLILLFSIFSSLLGISQDVHIKSKEERIKILEDSTFVNEISIIFEESNEPRFYPIVYDTELEQLSEIQLFVKKGRRLKELSKLTIYEEDVNLDYITSKRFKSVEIPANSEAKLTYLVSCKELMYFSSLQFFSYNKIDTIKYQINVPKTFELTHNTIHKDSLSFFEIDSTQTLTDATWNIKVSPKRVEPDPLQFFGIYKNMKVPLMRILVMPSSYKKQPINYMNDWYFKNVATKKGLDYSAKQKIDELTANITDPSKIINIIYSYVKSNFKYVAIEIGMGAFIPTHANEVFLNKQGDCKDLSNFLSEALAYKGIKSDIALAATFDHISDCNFPSLSSANHVIGIAYVNGKTILLDPTDPIHKEGTPVQSLQDRTILIVNSEGGSFYDVKRYSPQQNEIHYQLDLKIDDNNTGINGSFEIDYKGISSNYLKRNLKSDGEKEFLDYGTTFYEEVFGNQLISDLVILNESEQVNLKGDISIDGKTFNDGSIKYLFIDFLPRLIETESRETLLEGTYLRNPFYKKVRATIKLNEPIEPFKALEHSYEGEGISLKITIQSKSNLEIECNYDFVFDHIFIGKKNMNETNDILKSFKKIINEPIVLQKQ